MTIRLLIAEDNPVTRMGLAGLIGLEDDIEVVAEAGTGREAVSLAGTHQPDVILMDVRMPVMDGLEATTRLADRHTIVMLTYAEDAEIVTRAIRLGAAGYLVHGRFLPHELTDAIRRAARGESVVSPSVTPVLFDAVRRGDVVGAHGAPHSDGPGALTDREIEIMNQIATGQPNHAIAETLYISEKTVKNHINRAYAKLGVTNRAEAIARWLGTERRLHVG